jgi:LPS-assembly protein
MRSQLHFVITAALLCHLFPGASQVTSQALPVGGAQEGSRQAGCHVELTAPPGKPAEAASTAPAEGALAKPPRILISPDQPVVIDADQCEKAGEIYTLRGHVQIKFADYLYRGDIVVYDSVSGNVTATGHAALDGGPRDMHITAMHGTYNVRTQTGKFYDVNGTTGAHFRGNNVTLTSSSPLAFTAKEMEQTGPEEYVLHHGSVTSCELPHPKWRFHAARIILRVGDSAKVYNSTFRIKGVPVLYLPYASPPVERLGRKSGFLVPTIGNSTSKGTIIGDSYYWAINRTMDATLGGEFLSKRGWLLQEDFRARPSQTSFINFNYFQVLDRGGPLAESVINPSSPTPNAVVKVNQGGEDIKLNAAALLPEDVRGVASIEYLSSFLFREQFSPTFTQAVDSEVRSSIFFTKNLEGYFFNAFGSRYQNFQSTVPGDAITILHTPAVELASVDHRIFGSPIYWSYDVAGEGLRRSEPGFDTPGLSGRFDIDPNFSLPLLIHGWSLRPAVDLRNTVYTEQDIPGATGPVPTRNLLNRRVLDSSVEIRPPALEKVFDRAFAGRTVKHVIEPRVTYHYSNGVEDFASIIRFDFRDIVSNTNELEFGLLQRFYLKRAASRCGGHGTEHADNDTKACPPAGADEFLTWEVKQKYFLDPNFGGAVVNGRRNVFTTTADFTGIAFLTGPRHFSPIVSRLRFRSLLKSDLEWQLDYDSQKGRINASTVYVTHRFGGDNANGTGGGIWSNFFVGGSHAYLQATGEVVFAPGTNTVLPPCIPGGINTVLCVPEKFDQIRGLVGYGSPTKRGFSAAGNVGYDFEFKETQYTAVQTAYNWDCCGLSIEYRRFELGQVRRENQYRFAFTLANIGSFGNMKRQERLF